MASVRAMDEHLDTEVKEVKDEEYLLKEALAMAVDVQLPKPEIEAVSRRLEGVRVTRELNDALESNQLERLEKALKKAEKGIKKNKMDVTSTRLSDALEVVRHRVRVLQVIKQLDDVAKKTIPTGLPEVQKHFNDLEELIKTALVAGAKETDLAFAQKRSTKIAGVLQKLQQEQAAEQKRHEDEKQRKEEETRQKEEAQKKKEEEKKKKEEEREKEQQRKRESEIKKKEEEKEKKRKEEETKKKQEEEKKKKDEEKKKKEEEKEKKKEEGEKKKEHEKLKEQQAKQEKMKPPQRTFSEKDFKIVVIPPTLKKPIPPVVVVNQNQSGSDLDDSGHSDIDDPDLTESEEETDTDDEFQPSMRDKKDSNSNLSEEGRSRTDSGFRVRRIAPRRMSDSNSPKHANKKKNVDGMTGNSSTLPTKSTAGSSSNSSNQSDKIPASDKHKSSPPKHHDTLLTRAFSAPEPGLDQLVPGNNPDEVSNQVLENAAAAMESQKQQKCIVM